MIDPEAIIGRPPEHRDHRDEPGIAPMVHQTARVEALVTIDAGISAPTWIGARSWLMKRCHIGHDAIIGEDCELAPGCIVGGHVHIQNRVRVGMGAIFKPFVIVGNGARIGCGAVVIHNVPAGEVWAGNPAKRIHQHADAQRQRDHELDMVERDLLSESAWERIAESVGRDHPLA